jgi:uncharacterized Fe-S cluster protein YjdI
MTQKKYSNEDITVIWKLGLCQHSARCWKGLINVFDPQKKPWINIDGDTSERIIEQVKKCPSGALSYFENSKTNAESQPISG